MSDAADWTDKVNTKPRKVAISLRMDADVLEHFKAGGKGWQTRINEVLRAYVQAQQKKDLR
jgi:uncharacterized protein (DUF4415 family)